MSIDCIMIFSKISCWSQVAHQFWNGSISCTFLKKSSCAGYSKSTGMLLLLICVDVDQVKKHIQCVRYHDSTSSPWQILPACCFQLGFHQMKQEFSMQEHAACSFSPS
mmetsp:Transcript_15156/g.51124  ORF Transcript_15156/g.51124 Transcript_15156/m.51124 type:complete len:108 (-) Transcript_15156:83-406(-)